MRSEAWGTEDHHRQSEPEVGVGVLLQMTKGECFHPVRNDPAFHLVESPKAGFSNFAVLLVLCMHLPTRQILSPYFQAPPIHHGNL